MSGRVCHVDGGEEHCVVDGPVPYGDKGDSALRERRLLAQKRGTERHRQGATHGRWGLREASVEVRRVSDAAADDDAVTCVVTPTRLPARRVSR